MTGNNEEEPRPETEESTEEQAEKPEDQQTLKFEEPISAEDFEKEIDQVEKEAQNDLEKTIEGLFHPRPMPNPEESNKVPSWVKIPQDEKFRFPKSRTIYFLRFRAEWTDTPSLGDRQCICWPITVGDKKLAGQRAMGDGNRMTDEMTKRFIRVIDGVPVTETGAEEGNLEVWWNEVGERMRNQLLIIFSRAHTLNSQQQADFLENCVAVRTGG